jgi:hypothetical protein
MIPIKNLHKFAGGLNIEGGFPALELKKHNQKGIWANLAVVLDQPVMTGETFDDLLGIVTENDYPLLENAINDLNEHKYIAASLLIIIYYLINVPKILNETRKLNMIIHIHQDVTCKPLLMIIKDYLSDIMRLLDLDEDKYNIKYLTDHGVYRKSDHNYENVDVLISISQCAGLAPEAGPGSMIISNEFIPYDVGNKCIHLDKKYQVDNDLVHRLQTILNSDLSEIVSRYVDNKYFSNNTSKNGRHNVFPLTDSSFAKAKILQVDGLWNPSNPDELVQIYPE